ncbi:MAG: hypothetical protein E7638_01020 [Ruminococcaceae bacterium]|nr:hypothetical protein [Oscillospiraceae bacterium]
MKKTKYMIGALLLAMTALFSSCGNNNELDAPGGMKIACDPEITDYRLFVPEEWTVDMTTSASGAYYSNSDPSGVSMMVWDLEYANSTLDDWWAANETDIAMVFDNYALESKENTTIDGNYAQKYVYTADLGENQYKVMQIGALKDGTVYLFTYTSLQNLYDSHLEDVAAIVENIIIE